MFALPEVGAPSASLGHLQKLEARLRTPSTPERRRSSSEARRGLGSPPEAGPNVRISLNSITSPGTCSRPWRTWRRWSGRRTRVRVALRRRREAGRALRRGRRPQSSGQGMTRARGKSFETRCVTISEFNSCLGVITSGNLADSPVGQRRGTLTLHRARHYCTALSASRAQLITGCRGRGARRGCRRPLKGPARSEAEEALSRRPPCPGSS